MANPISGDNDANVIVGSGADDSITGAGGDDVIAGRGGDDTIRAGTGNDEVNGNGDNDRIAGSGGDDKLIGGGGNDALSGGSGNDTVKGGSGDDVVNGGAGDDRLIGGSGNDRLIGGEGDDTMAGGSGADVFVFSGLHNTGRDIISDFTVGEDRLALTNGATVTDVSEVGNGNTMLTLSNGGTVILRGVTPEDYLAGASTNDGDDDDDEGPMDPPVPFDPGSQTESTSGTLPSSGQDIDFDVTTAERTNDGTSPVEALVGLSGVNTDQINIAYVYDESGSVGASLFDLETAALIGLTEELVSLGFTNDQVDIGAIPFSSTGLLDGVFDPEDPANPGEINPALETALTTRNFFGGTNFENALQTAESFFAQVDPNNEETNIVYFISDGEDFGGPFADEVARLTDPDGINAQILAFGVAGAVTSQLNAIDNTGGAVVLSDANDLDASVIGSPISGATVDDFFILVNGADSGIDETDLVTTPFGFVLPETELTGLLSMMGDTNTVEATVSFDDVDDTTLTVNLTIDGAGDLLVVG